MTDYLFNWIKSSVSNLENSLRHSHLLNKFSQMVASSRNSLTRLQYKSISTCHSHRGHPKRNHQRKIKWGYSSTHSHRLLKRISIYSLSYIHYCLSHCQTSHWTTVLNNLKTSLYISSAVSQCFTSFLCYNLCKFLIISTDKLLEIKHITLTNCHGSLTPFLRNTLWYLNNFIKFILSCLRNFI